MRSRVVNVRDAIILSMLKRQPHSRGEITDRLGIQKSITDKSLSFLRSSGFVARRQYSGSEVFMITDQGVSAIEGIHRRLSTIA